MPETTAGVAGVNGARIAYDVTGSGPDDEPGLVHFGCLRRGGDVVHREEHFGDIGRGPVRLKCLEVALDMLDQNLANLR